MNISQLDVNIVSEDFSELKNLQLLMSINSVISEYMLIKGIRNIGVAECSVSDLC